MHVKPGMYTNKIFCKYFYIYLLYERRYTCRYIFSFMMFYQILSGTGVKNQFYFCKRQYFITKHCIKINDMTVYVIKKYLCLNFFLHFSKQYLMKIIHKKKKSFQWYCSHTGI